jgi:hypothetical protein
VTVYKVEVSMSGDTGTDAADIAVPYGKVGDSVSIAYTLDSTGTQSNTLTYSGATSNPAQVTTPGTNTSSYTIAVGDATIGVITLMATFEHTNTPDTAPPVLSAGSANRTSDTAATIGFITDEAGTAYYLAQNSGDGAPANTAVKAGGASLGAVPPGASIDKAVTLTAGAKDIYVVVEDAAGNISAPLKIEVAAFVANFAITGGTTYATLAEALAEVPDGGTITMLQDVTSGLVDLDVNRTYTLDLGGYTLSGNASPLLHIWQGTIAIQNGSVATAGGCAIAVNGGTVNILNGSYTGDDDAIYAPGGTVTITSGHFVSTTDGWNDGCLVTGGGQINIAAGSEASVDPWKNSGSVTDVTVAFSVTNTGGSATVTYAGTTIDLSSLGSLFTIDADAGTPTYSIEATGSPTGEGSIGGDNKTLSVTRAGAFTIGLVTAATGTHAAGAKVTATLTVNKGSQSAPSAPTLDAKTTTSITLDTITGAEYQRGGAWQDSPTFSGLTPNTGYTFHARLKATDRYNVSPTRAASATFTSD